ncbi:MAG: hypothetical protein K2X55_22120 [Burkholderiaceae bacterium]|nr:hypothetical protein [Burkholderiaceae bacterium]
MKFENDWLPWIALRHFLPASSIRSLCATMAHDMSGGQLSLEDLVDERLGGGNAFMETWLIRPKICSTQLARHLQLYVQRIVWQNDKEAWSVDESIKSEAAIPPAALEFAFNLGVCDMQHVIKALPDDEYVQDGLRSLYSAISMCAASPSVSSSSEIAHLLERLDEVLANVSSQLRIVTIKHLGDLFSDRDEWVVAKKLHEHAKGKLEELTEPEKFSDIALAITACINQSLATSATITDGYGAGQKMLAELLSNPLAERTIILANAGFDEYAARVRSSHTILQEDTRSATLIAPLLADSHSTENALTSWRQKSFPDAATWFWSTLRRQTALGLHTANKTTKGQYASCLIDELMSRKSYDAATFRLAIGLLIESESSDWAKEVRWSEDLVDACVDETLCQYVINHVEAHEGVCKRRRTVAVALFAEWARNISAGRAALATLMLNYLIKIGSDSNANLFNAGADLKTCFEAVLDICKRRPEFRLGIRDELANVLALRIGSAGYWTGEDIALRLATECASVFTDDGLKRVVSSAVALLKKVHPSDGNWVVVKPALRLLSEECVGNLAGRNGELGNEIVLEVLKFNGSDDGTYSADIIFTLNCYPPVLLRTQGVEDQFKLLIEQALKRASAINSSNAVNNMMALLVAPKSVGQQTVVRVLQILVEILDSVERGKASLSFGSAYMPIRYLVAYGTDICRESDTPLEEFNRSLAELCGKLLRVWGAATTNPAIFAPLSLLRVQRAERAIVHNWVIASLELAESVDLLEAMVRALDAARDQEQLSDGISLGFATRRASGAAAGDTDAEFMSTESRGAFYAAIGRRLCVLQGNIDRRFTTDLFKNMLRHGPRQVDVAVFASIMPSDVDQLSNLVPDLDDYKARIGDSHELALTLVPMLDRWIQAARA